MVGLRASPGHGGDRVLTGRGEGRHQCGAQADERGEGHPEAHQRPGHGDHGQARAEVVEHQEHDLPAEHAQDSAQERAAAAQDQPGGQHDPRDVPRSAAGRHHHGQLPAHAPGCHGERRTDDQAHLQESEGAQGGSDAQRCRFGALAGRRLRCTGQNLPGGDQPAGGVEVVDMLLGDRLGADQIPRPGGIPPVVDDVPSAQTRSGPRRGDEGRQVAQAVDEDAADRRGGVGAGVGPGGPQDELRADVEPVLLREVAVDDDAPGGRGCSAVGERGQAGQESQIDLGDRDVAHLQAVDLDVHRTVVARHGVGTCREQAGELPLEDTQVEWLVPVSGAAAADAAKIL